MDNSHIPNTDDHDRRVEVNGPEGPIEQHGGSGVDLEPSKGAKPSNTAPSNHINPESTKILRKGIDSLYISYTGSLTDGWLEKLDQAELQAQSPEEWEQAMAQVIVGNTFFAVSDRGRKFFCYVLKNQRFEIALAKPSKSLKQLAYIQLRSSAITADGVDSLLDAIDVIMNTIAEDVSGPNISRIDLFADFTTTHEINGFTQQHFVTRSRRLSEYYEGGRPSGWTVGAGGDISFRLYDKTLELKTSNKVYLLPLWFDAGWNMEDTIWRAEFQLRKPVLKQLDIGHSDAALSQLGAIWHYATHQWLRIVHPNTADVSRYRWPTHPFWASLQDIDWQKPFE